MAAAAAAMAVAAAAAMAAAATPGLVAATSAGSPLDAEVAAGSEVAAASGSSLDAEVAARSEVAAGSEVAGAAAAGSSCSVTTDTMTTDTMTTGTVVAAAYPGEHAARAKSHSYGTSLAAVLPYTETAPLTDAVPSAHHAWIEPLRLALAGATRSGTAGGDCLLAVNAGSRSVDQGHVVAAEEP